jgi:hypothetical protein
MNMQNDIANSLDTKLDATLDALVDVNVNDDGTACNSLQAFISAVQAQRGIKITNAQDDQVDRVGARDSDLAQLRQLRSVLSMSACE